MTEIINPDMNDPAVQEMLREAMRDTDESMNRFKEMRAADRRDYGSWLVTVPPYDHDGVKIERFTVSEAEAATSMLRAAFNPQRGDRSVEPGTYTRLEVDGVLWMSDTPAEIRDHDAVDTAMKDLCFPDSSMLIVGLGLGMILQRAIMRWRIPRIDVVEKDPRVVEAVQNHYIAMANKQQCELGIYTGDIHTLSFPRGMSWDLGYFDIWADIDCTDTPEVRRLKSRFYRRLGTFLAWAQDERSAQAKRIRNRTGWY